MPDWPEDDLDLDGPRALPDGLRRRLADALAAGAGADADRTVEGEGGSQEDDGGALALGDALASRLEQALHDPLESALADLDGPRPLPAEARRRLEARLLVRPRRRPALVGGGVAAAAVLLAAVGLALAGAGTTGQGPAQASRPSPGTPSAAPSTAAPGSSSSGALSSGSAAAGPGVVQASPTANAPDALRAPGTVPTVTGITPPGGPVTGGGWVVIDGTGFDATVAVTFGAVPAASFTVVSPTVIRARAPAHAPGTVDVQVRTPPGTSAATPADRYRYR